MPQHTAVATIHTNHGDIVVNLFGDQAPRTVQNFVGLSDGSREWTHPATGKPGEGALYTDVIFHRIIEGFMIQGGGFTPDMQHKPAGDPIENEADNGLANATGTLAMARTSDPHSASSQFFINVSDNAFLNHSGKNPQGWGYAVFGNVVDGMDAVNAIKGVATGRHGMHQDVPKEPVEIQKVTISDAYADK
mgnify:CR=1 FL=1